MTVSDHARRTYRALRVQLAGDPRNDRPSIGQILADAGKSWELLQAEVTEHSHILQHMESVRVELADIDNRLSLLQSQENEVDAPTLRAELKEEQTKARNRLCESVDIEAAFNARLQGL